MKPWMVGTPEKLGHYMIEHCLGHDYEGVVVCRAGSVSELEEYWERIAVIPGRTNDVDVIQRASAGRKDVLGVLAAWGVKARYSSGTAQAVLDFAEPSARLIFSCGWHITRDGEEAYSRRFRAKVKFLELAMRF